MSYNLSVFFVLPCPSILTLFKRISFII